MFEIILEGVFLFGLMFLSGYLGYSCGFSDGLKKFMPEIKEIHDLMIGKKKV